MFRNKYDLCVAPNKYRLWIACPVKPPVIPATTTSTTSTEGIFNPFMITIDTTKAGSANNTFILPVYSGTDYDVDWGDGGALEHFVRRRQ